MKKKIVHEIKSLLLITVATLIYAVGISLFLDPNQLAPGGVTGIAVILNRLVEIETGTLYFLLNLPLVLLGIWKFGMRFIAKTAYAILLVSVFTNLLSPIGALTDDLLIAHQKLFVFAFTTAVRQKFRSLGDARSIRQSSHKAPPRQADCIIRF